MWQIWLLISGTLFVAEIITVGFLVFWFAIGALLAMLVSFFTDNIIIQTTVFIISSTLLLFATKPLVKKFANNKDSIKTNVYSIVGKNAIVKADIDSLNNTGLIKVEGETWSAISDNNYNIPKGTEVKILDVKGVKAVVTPIK